MTQVTPGGEMVSEQPPLRVALITFSGGLGGREQVVFNLARAFELFGLETHTIIVVETRADEGGQEQIRRAFDELPPKANRRLLQTSSRYSKTLERTLVDYFDEHAITIAHSHCYKAGCYMQRIKQKTRHQFRNVFTLHGLFLDPLKLSSYLIYPSQWLTALYTDAIIACAHHLQSPYSWIPWVKSKIRVIQNGIGDSKKRQEDVSALKKEVAAQYQLDVNADWIVNVSRLSPEKNVHLYLELAKGYFDATGWQSKVQFLVVGDGEELPMLKTVVESYGLGEKVKFLGYCQDVESILLCADLFMLTSKTEGTSISILEAMRASLPVMVTAVPGNQAIIEDQCNGVLFAKDNLTKSIAQLAALMSSPEKRQQLGLNGYRNWMDNFSFHSCYQKHMKLYQNILED